MPARVSDPCDMVIVLPTSELEEESDRWRCSRCGRTMGRIGTDPGIRAQQLADPEGNPFCVMEQRAGYVDTGPVAALPLDVADPDRERDFWCWLTGWVPVAGSGLLSLQHSSRRGPLLELCPEVAPKGSGKNRMHLDVRLQAGDDADAVARGIADRGGRELHLDWGDLPWRVFADPSGNEFCVLPARG
jgi:hypothetical protein